jgi:hypothetical protein
MDVAESDGSTWRFSGIYGESHDDKKHKTWEAMRDLNGQHGGGPWLCAGDFNEVLFAHEKRGEIEGAGLHGLVQSGIGEL